MGEEAAKAAAEQAERDRIAAEQAAEEARIAAESEEKSRQQEAEAARIKSEQEAEEARLQAIEDARLAAIEAEKQKVEDEKNRLRALIKAAEEALFELNVKREGVQKRNESEVAHLNHKKMISKKRARMGLIRQESSMDEEHPGSDLVVSEGMVMMTTTIVDTAGGEGATKKITTLAPRPKKTKAWQLQKRGNTDTCEYILQRGEILGKIQEAERRRGKNGRGNVIRIRA